MRFHLSNRTTGMIGLLGGLLWLVFAGGETYGQPDAAVDRGNAPVAATAESETVEDLSTSRVYLYFGDREGEFLKAEERRLPPASDPQQRARQIIAALIQGPENGLTRTLPPETSVRSVYLLADGTLYVDFSAPIRDNHPGGIGAETITIYSVVNSLVLNVADIRQVKILVAGTETDTLAGHLDIREPFVANMVLVR